MGDNKLHSLVYYHVLKFHLIDMILILKNALYFLYLHGKVKVFERFLLGNKLL